MITTPLTRGAWCHLPRQDELVRHDLEQLAEPGDRPLVARAGVLGSLTTIRSAADMVIAEPVVRTSP